MRPKQNGLSKLGIQIQFGKKRRAAAGGCFGPATLRAAVRGRAGMKPAGFVNGSAQLPFDVATAILAPCPTPNNRRAPW